MKTARSIFRKIGPTFSRKTSTTIIPALALALLLGLGFLPKGAWVYAANPVSRLNALETEGSYQCCSSPNCDSTISPTKIGSIFVIRAEEKATGADIFDFFTFNWLDRNSTRSLSLQAGVFNDLETATNLASENPSILFQGTMPISGFYFLSGQGEGTGFEGTLTVQGQIQAQGASTVSRDRDTEGDVNLYLPDLEIFREVFLSTTTSWEDATITGTGSVSLNDPEAEALLPPELSGEFDLGFPPCNPATGSFSSSDETGVEILMVKNIPAPFCGDGQCTGNEDAASCPADCTSCGDGLCTEGEDLATCPGDCAVCGDGTCTAGVEDASSCPVDCASTCPLCEVSCTDALECQALFEGSGLPDSFINSIVCQDGHCDGPAVCPGFGDLGSISCTGQASDYCSTIFDFSGSTECSPDGCCRAPL